MSWYKRDLNGDIVKNVSNPLSEFEDSITEQHHEPETNINNIVARNGLELRQSVDALQNMRFDDVQNNDFQEMMNMLINAKESFSDIPSQIRNQFDNDPAKFLDFVHNPDSKDQLIEWGLANAEDPAPKPMRVVMVNEDGTIVAPAAEAPAP